MNIILIGTWSRLSGSFCRRIAMHGKLRWALVLLAAACGPSACLAADASGNPAVMACRDLRGRTFGNSTVRTAAPVAGGVFHAPDGRTYSKLPDFCRVILTASPSPVSNITIEVWMPSTKTWNAKLMATGNGAFGGAIRYELLADAVQRDYVAANTDMGTYPANIMPGAGYDAGIAHPEMVKDWGYRASHVMTLAAKALIKDYYGQQPSRSYFVGCSTGGHQALTEAQRFPDDYDGIIAGAPGNNRTHLHAAFLHRLQLSKEYGPIFSQEKVSLVSKAIMSACTVKDGGAPGDNFLTNPATCDFEPKKLLCTAGQNGDSCLSANEVKLLDAFFDGTRNPRTHQLIYPPSTKDEEVLAMMRILHVPIDPKLSNADGLLRWVFGPEWDASKFDFDHDMATVDENLGATINALDPDLSRFAKHGGKLIMYHGWADPVVSPFDTIGYFDRINGVSQASDAEPMLKEPSSFSRLFMVPGMSHCVGGPGPNMFGQELPPPDGPPNSARDVVAALDKWVETGTAPETLLATRQAPDGAAQTERPICAYPKVAKYNGTGDPIAAASFSCVAAPIGNIEFPAPPYLGQRVVGLVR